MKDLRLDGWIRNLVMVGAALGLLWGAVPAGAQITNSAHDFSGETWNPSGEICVTCHTPHNADTSVTESPLWNHAVTASTFTLYSSATLDAVMGQPDGASKLCLSCHDGTVALDSFGGQTGSQFIDAEHLIGTDLSDDHPVSFTYDAALATLDGELQDPSTASSGLGSTIDEDLLFNARLQCASCHDAHNGAGLDNLLVIDNAGSALCLTCHIK